MNWERFSYLCRRLHRTLESNEPTSEIIARIDLEAGTQLYSNNKSLDTLTRNLLSDIGRMPNATDVKEVAALYSKLDLSAVLTKPIQFKRATIYLSYLTFVFLVLSAIYGIYVIPSFEGSFEALNLQSPPAHLFIEKYSVIFFPIIIGLLIAAVILSVHLKRLFNFTPGFENRLILRLFALPEIVSSYRKIIDTIHFPVRSMVTAGDDSNNSVQKHLAAIKDSNMCLRTEMQAIINLEIATLAEHCERQMRFITVFIAVLIIGAIFYFVVGAYSPIFMIGDEF